ncbi:MAG: membrane protein insertase YidC [Deltaproteobacteria bacterium]|nr:membrane protein insertase YidC [Candidatus Deferrimicrobiaceae bacterium]
MQKNMILAIVLSIAILLGYQYFFAPPPKVPAPPQGTAQEAGKDNAARPAAQQGSAAPATPAEAPPPGLVPKTSPPVRQIRVSTPLYTATISTGGGGIPSFRLNDYKDVPGPKGRPLEIIGSDGTRPLPLDLYLNESEPSFPPIPVFSSAAPDALAVGAGEKKSVLLTWESARGVRIVREYEFSGGRYDFAVREQVSNGSKEPIRLRPGFELSQDFKGELAADSYTFTGAVVETKGKIEQLDLKKIGKGKIEKYPVSWAAADSKYFGLILMPEKPWTLEQIGLSGETGIRMSVADAPAALSPGETVRSQARMFAGPKRYDLLKETGKGLEELIDYGWFSIVAKPLVWLMKASNRVTRNYGIDIIILTILIKVLFFPLTQKSMVSMKKMQDLQPILAKLREKYKDDTQRLNQETMNLYKTYKINPLSGCLPMLLQIPVFIALYKGLLVTIELRHAPFFLWINDLSAPEHLWDIPVAGYTIPIRLLPLLMGISMFVQQKMTPAAGDPNQQKIMLLMPVIFTFMFWGFPTGLVIYWLANNVLSIGQQMIHNAQAEAAKKATPA